MPLNPKHILSPNSEFDRRQELAKALEQQLILTTEDRNLLRQCPTEDHEAIGMIGCLLNEDNCINKARLIIAYSNRFNYDLSDQAEKLLDCNETELELLIDNLSKHYIENDDKLSNYENKIYSILFRILSNREFS